MKTKCPHCHTVQSAPADSAGKRAKCRYCHGIFIIAEYTHSTPLEVRQEPKDYSKLLQEHVPVPQQHESLIHRLAKFFSVTTKGVTLSEPIGNVEAICPYCNGTLEKKPRRKKKCPHCNEFIYVRTRPTDGQQVLVRHDQREDIEEQWAIANGTHRDFLVMKKKRIKEQERFGAVKLDLSKRFGREASDNDAKWHMLNEDLITIARSQDWGLFRNVKFAMAELLRKEKKLHQSLGTLCEVCYLDINGPNNMGGITDRNTLREFPPWTPKDGILAPGIIGRLLDIADELSMDTKALEGVFLRQAEALTSAMKLPVAPDKAWRKLKREL